MSNWLKVADTFIGLIDLAASVVFEDELYSAGGGDGALIKLNSAGNAWELVASQYSTTDDIWSLVVFDGRLYGGGANSGSDLVRLNLAKNAWELVATQYAGEPIRSMAVFNDRLYCGGQFDAQLLRLNIAGDTLELVASTFIHSPVLDGIHCLSVFDGRLYGGTEEGVLLRLNLAGDAWELVAETGNAGQKFYKLTVFENRLYIGTEDTDLLLRLNTTKDALEVVVSAYKTETEIVGLIVFNESLYATTSSSGFLVKLNDSYDGFEKICNGLDSQEWMSEMVLFNDTIYSTTGWDGYLFKVVFSNEFNQISNSPCPPDFSDYEILAIDSNLIVPALATLDKFQRSDTGNNGSLVGTLVEYLYESGEKYFFGCEGNFTNANFSGGVPEVRYWQPSAWVSLSASFNTPTGILYLEEDVPPFNCPYPYKLNDDPFVPGEFGGGFRFAEITAEETGLYRFFFGFQVFR